MGVDGVLGVLAGGDSEGPRCQLLLLQNLLNPEP